MGRAIEMASSDLLWALTRKNNSFLVKRNGLQQTSEPNNLTGKHCFKYSGLANEEAVGVEECPRGITLKKKNKKNAMAPKRNVVSIDLKKDFQGRPDDQEQDRGCLLQERPHQGCPGPLVQDLEEPEQGRGQ